MSRREQRVLTLSLWGVAAVAVGSTAYGLYLESDVVVGPRFALQTIPQQDRLRERIWAATGLPLDRAWVSICLTADPRWV